MPKLRVHAFSISLDGYGAGPDQDLANPQGVGGLDNCTSGHVATRTIPADVRARGWTTGDRRRLVARGFANIGAWILGRNMFGPVRGPWPDDTWKGWWGDNPPYHCAGVRADQPSARLARHGRRHHLPLRHRRHPRGAGARHDAANGQATSGSAAASPRSGSI